MQIGETLYATTREEFRKWLKKNHRSKKEIWLIQYKKATRKLSINFAEAVEEAMCFGWTESIGFKSMDAERYVTRYTPRRPASKWSDKNKDRARRLIAEGRMTEAGRVTLPPGLKEELS
jgi:uncharacterized protein YdeI (YjbR/CyaY-like superfamily)